MYRTVSLQMLEDRDMEVHNMVNNPRLPIDVVFNSDENLVFFAELGGQPFTTTQTVSKTYYILNKI